MEEYKPNSYKYKEEQKRNSLPEKRAEKVITNNVVVKKQSTTKRFVNEFISDDAKKVKSFVLGEILIPTIKKVISDIVVNATDIILYGESKRQSGRTTVDRVSYNNYSTNYRTRYDNNCSTSYRSSTYSYDDIIFSNRGDAEKVLDAMDDIIATYGVVRVADLFDLVDRSSQPTDNAYGWNNISSAEVIRVRTDNGYGYKIMMPRVIDIR